MILASSRVSTLARSASFSLRRRGLIWVSKKKLFTIRKSLNLHLPEASLMLDLRFLLALIDSILALLSTNFVLIWSLISSDSVTIPDLTFVDLLKSICSMRTSERERDREKNFIICSFLGFLDSLAKRMVFSEFVVQTTWRDRS